MGGKKKRQPEVARSIERELFKSRAEQTFIQQNLVAWMDYKTADTGREWGGRGTVCCLLREGLKNTKSGDGSLDDRLH